MPRINRFNHALTNLAKAAGKKVGKLLIKKLIALLLPFAPIILIVLLVTLLVGLTYYSMTSQTALTGPDPGEADREIKGYYEELVHTCNRRETWLVPGESSKDKPYYPASGSSRIEEMVDDGRKDYMRQLKWGTVHSVGLYWAYCFNKESIPDELRERIATDLRPYFYYKKSTVHVKTKTDEGTRSHSYDIYLLVEANTIYGWYQYHYKWETKTGGNTTVTREVLDNTTTLAKWERLDNYLKQLYETEADPDIELSRTAVLEAGEGFTEEKERMEWLLKNAGYSFVSPAMIPSDLIRFFEEAEKEFGIPWWFLAAVAFKESSFNPQAENSQTGCYGLMQVSPENWNRYAPQLGFDPVSDRDNPKAQIFVGAYMLKSAGLGSVDWNGDWKEDTLRVLQYYGGYARLPVRLKALYGSVEEWCRKEYAEPIWETAEKLKGAPLSNWPVSGSVTSSYGWRELFGKREFHNGIDIGTASGTPVVSVSGGVVTSAGWDDPNDHSASYGLRITVRDGIHMYLYAHLLEGSLLVKPGDTVSPGQQIAAVGSTGRSTGPHLHFGVQENGCWINPFNILQRAGD